MLVLAIDTAGKSGGIALARGDSEHFDLIGASSLSGGTYSARLVPAIAELLEQHRLTKSQIEGLAAASGPGSFTGLRVGLGAVKALAEALRKPIVAVSVLETVAAEAQLASPVAARAAIEPHRVVALVDAGRGEVYLGEFSGPPQRFATERQLLLSRDETLELLRGMGRQETDPRHVGLKIVTADEAIAANLEATGIAVNRVRYPGAEMIARLGVAKLARGEIVSATDLDANYIRRSDAEIFSAKR